MAGPSARADRTYLLPCDRPALSAPAIVVVRGPDSFFSHAFLDLSLTRGTSPCRPSARGGLDLARTASPGRVPARAKAASLPPHSMRQPWHPASTTVDGRQFLRQDLLHDLGVGLAAAGLHYRAHEEPETGLLLLVAGLVHSTALGLAARASSTIFSRAPASEVWMRFSRSAICCGVSGKVSIFSAIVAAAVALIWFLATMAES